MDNFVITIARGYGSGGKYIGTELAKQLNIPLLDRELLYLASEESGINEELFELCDEKLKSRILDIRKKSNVVVQKVLPPENRKFTSNDNLFHYQAKVLMTLAEKKSFVVIGRAANYILKDMKNVVSVNIQAPFKDCVESIMTRKMVSREQAEKDIRVIDKYRHKYYEYHTGQEWDDIEDFDLFLNSSRVGREECVSVIKDYLERKKGKGVGSHERVYV